MLNKPKPPVNVEGKESDEILRPVRLADNKRQYLEKSLIKLINDYEDETGCEITNIEITRERMVSGKSLLASVDIAITIPKK